MKLYQDLKYVGNDKRLDLFTDKIWHCTSMVKEYSTNETKFCMQQPYCQDGELLGYTNFGIYSFTEDELVENFKIIKEDGTLEDIQHSRDNVELQQKLKETKEYFENMTDEEFEKFISKVK